MTRYTKKIDKNYSCKMNELRTGKKANKMRVFTKSELDNIIQKNSDFVKGVAGGVRADLSDSDLHDTDLRFANLRDADLSDSDLHDTDLSGADLRFANLRGADLSGSDLSSAYLSSADLRDSDLRLANLRGAILTGAYLSSANIANAFLDEEEQLRKGTILKKKMIGYKKLEDGSICVLSIPKGAIVFSINGTKCRTNRASVLEGGGASSYDRNFVYKKGEKYEIADFNPAYNLECASGIHFFKTRKEAVDYKS